MRKVPPRFILSRCITPCYLGLCCSLSNVIPTLVLVLGEGAADVGAIIHTGFDDEFVVEFGR